MTRKQINFLLNSGTEVTTHTLIFSKPGVKLHYLPSLIEVQRISYNLYAIMSYCTVACFISETLLKGLTSDLCYNLQCVIFTRTVYDCMMYRFRSTCASFYTTVNYSFHFILYLLFIQVHKFLYTCICMYATEST